MRKITLVSGLLATPNKCHFIPAKLLYQESYYFLIDRFSQALMPSSWAGLFTARFS